MVIDLLFHKNLFQYKQHTQKKQGDQKQKITSIVIIIGEMCFYVQGNLNNEWMI